MIQIKWIITAAHCFPNPHNVTDQLIKKDRIHALMGTNKHFDSVEETFFLHGFIDRIIPHKDYREYYDNNMKRVATTYNIALVKTRQPSILSTFVQIIEIPTKREGTKACRQAIIIGSGIIKSTGNASENLLYANTKIYEGPLNVAEWLRSSTVFYTVDKWSNGFALFREGGGSFVCYHGDVPVLYGIRLGGYSSKENNTDIVISTYESIQAHMSFIKEYVPNVLIARKNMQDRNKPGTSENIRAVANSIKEDFYQIFCLLLFSFRYK